MAYLESVWQAVRNDAPVHPTHRQATALAGDSIASGRTARAAPGGRHGSRARCLGWTPDTESHEEQEAHWAAVRRCGRGAAKRLEKLLGPIVDCLLLTKGIRGVDSESRSLLFTGL